MRYFAPARLARGADDLQRQPQLCALPYRLCKSSSKRAFRTLATAGQFGSAQKSQNFQSLLPPSLEKPRSSKAFASWHAGCFNAAPCVILYSSPPPLPSPASP